MMPGRTGTARSWRLLGLVIVLLFLQLAQASHRHARIQGPSGDFSTHRTVRPRVYHGRSKREIDSTRESDTDHTDILSVGLELNGESRILDLRLNTDLIPAGYKERYQHRGTYKTHVPDKVEICHYQGSIREIPGSWAAVSTCQGLKGVIFDGETLHYIQPEEENLQSTHYLYKHSDLVANNTCGYKGTHHHIAEEFAATKKELSRRKRTTDEIRGPYNANRQSRYVELALVMDKNEYMEMGENLTRVYHHCKDIANIVNAMYTPLNIFIALVGIEVWADADEIHILSNGDTTLNNFLQYRRERLLKIIPNDNAQLLTKMLFEEGVVGKALKGPICTYEFSGGVAVDHSNVVGLVAATVAHELGHNFGMEHDSSDCTCPEDRCIMAPSSGTLGPTHWSSCSLEYLALAFEHGMDYCLRNKPRKLFDSPICGNGFVEPGEQCDCGLVASCDNPCCNASSCMLHANASCATGECCDLETCRPKPAGTQCRSADQECDLPEYCTGQSEYCPADVFKIDGESCSMGKAYCYQGGCRTHNDQCKLLWGPTGMSSDELCYEMNNKGTKNGNCGYNRTGQNYVRCNDENILCGMLHCKHLNERLEFGMESVAILSHSFINSQGNIIACRSAIVDLGLNEVDPGLAPDGARCAQGKMCVNQKCMPVADLRLALPGGKACPNNCSGNGVCNSLGHCHCNRGYQPPDCTQPGVGGSEDSGPAEDPNARSEYIMSLYIIFLGIVPTVGLVSLGVWYTRNNGSGTSHWKKPGSTGPISTLTRNFGFGGHHQHHQSRAPPPRGPGNCYPSIKTIDRASPLPRAGIDTVDSALGLSHQDPACASLLPKPDTDERFNNNFFGQFKGFTIAPLTAPGKPRAAPAPPTWASNELATTVPITTHPRTQPLRPAPPPGPNPVEEPAPPALPPPNAGSTARPLIGSPVLAATTCTSLELMGPKVPTRPAPEIPRPPRPGSSVPEPPAPIEKPSSGNTGTLTRIASMLYPMGRPTEPTKSSGNTLPRGQHHKATKVLDKEVLRTLEISNPIPQTTIEVPTGTIPIQPESATQPEVKKQRSSIGRTQSMRDPKLSSRPAIHSFGSMRQPDGPRRPTSLAAAARPTSPPPGPPVRPPPPEEAAKPRPEEAYDDCTTASRNVSRSSDNIYAVIEETTEPRPSPPTESEYKVPRSTESAAGLLSEIVSEISNRNLESIYSTKTLSPEPRESDDSSTYANTTARRESPRSVRSTSTTSSGYLHPSAVNPPENSTSETKKDSSRPSPGRSRTSKPTSASSSRSNSRQNSDSSLKTVKKPSPTKESKQPKLEGPDVVSSCGASRTTESPDVLGKDGKPKPRTSTLPRQRQSGTMPPKPTSLLTKAASFSDKNKTSPIGTAAKSIATAKAAIKPVAATKTSTIRSTTGRSNVASLQQKFERNDESQSETLTRRKPSTTVKK